MANPAPISGEVPNTGSRIGPYRLLEPLGRGGVALVFRAVDERSGQIVALKTAREVREGLLASIRREVRTLEHIRHPGVVKILEGGVCEGRPWYTMDLVEGTTLREHLLRHLGWRVSNTTEESPSMIARPAIDTLTSADGPPSSDGPLAASRPPLSAPSGRRLALGGDMAWFLTLIRRLCEPLAFIHGEGLVHRDLKPSNIFVRADGTPILMDFGLVWRLKVEDGREVLSVDAARAGTIAYMAPEQARGERMDARGDLFSLGCIMYEAITGELPYVAGSMRELTTAHGGPRPAPPSRLADGVPAGFDDLVMGLLQQQPRDRIGHASDVAAVLADMGAEGWPTAESPTANAYLYRPEIVGRAKFLEQALSHVTRVGEKGGGCIFVSGPSGIGKTSFASEVAHAAGQKGMRVVTGECTAVGVAEGRGLRRAGPLYPFGAFLQAVADQCVSKGSDVTARLLGERAKVLAVAEPSLLDLPGVDRYPQPAEVPGEAARRRLMDALAETLSAFSAEQPILLVLDDLQWADDLTLAFLASLSERYLATNRVLILGTLRSEEIGTDLARATTLPYVTNLSLDRLDANAIGAMASDMLGQRQVSESLASFLTAESSGNPFFVAEYLRAAVDAGLLFRDKRGHWQQGDGGIAFERLGLPRTVQALVARRLEALPGAPRQIAEVAAVLGREVEADVLSALALEVDAVPDEARFDESVRDLLARQVFESAASGSIRFVHDKLREIAYEGMSPERRRKLHGAAALLLERRQSESGTLERAYAALAHHFEAAGEDAKALAYFDKAGEVAHTMYANQEAVRLLEKAKAMEARGGPLATPTARARRERILGLNALALGNMKGAFDSLMEAASVAGRPWPASRGRLLGRLVLALGREVLSRSVPDLIQESRPDDTEKELLLEAARAYERLLVVNYYTTGDMLAVMLCAFTNMALAEQAGGASAERALGYATFGAMLSLVPLDGMAQAYCRRAIEAARDSGDEVAETWVVMNVAIVHLHAGRWAEMGECLDRVAALSQRMGFARRWEESRTQFSTACFLSGRFEQAAKLNQQLLGSIERADPQSKCWAIVREAEIALMQGKPQAALESAVEGERLCQQGLGRSEWIYALGPLALARLRTGDRAGAREAADACAEWISKESTPVPVFYNVFAYAALAEVYLDLWRGAEGKADKSALASAARRILKRLGATGRAMAVAAPRAALWRGMGALHLDGRRAPAIRLFRESLERARRLDMPYDEGIAVLALGECADQPSARAQMVTDAGDIFRRIGALHDLARVERIATP